MDDSGEDLPEIKQKIIREVFNKPSNKYGKNLKFILKQTGAYTEQIHLS